MYTLNTSFGVVKIHFQHTKDHRELMEWLRENREELPESVNLFRVARATMCGLQIIDRTYFGLSFCSWLDSFSPDKGKTRALKDAIGMSYLSREQRAELWAAFFEAKPDRESKKELVLA